MEGAGAGAWEGDEVCFEVGESSAELSEASAVEEDWAGASGLQQVFDVVGDCILDLVISGSFPADLLVEVPDGELTGSDLGDPVLIWRGGVLDDVAVLEDSPEPVLGMGVVLLLLQRLDAGE